MNITKVKTRIVVIFLAALVTSPQLAAQDTRCFGAPIFDYFDFWFVEPKISDDISGNQSDSKSATWLIINCLVRLNNEGDTRLVGNITFGDFQRSNELRQVWVAPGYAVENVGRLLDESMVLRGTVEYYSDKKFDFRRRWIPPGSGRSIPITGD